LLATGALKREVLHIFGLFFKKAVEVVRKVVRKTIIFSDIVEFVNYILLEVINPDELLTRIYISEYIV
jgi:hypothetical protein